MAVSFTYSNHYKYQLMSKLIDLGADSIKAVLCRDGFVFDKDVYASYLNMKATTGSLSVVFDATATTNTITRTTGSFITDGFVVGNRVTTTSDTNYGPLTITVVAALVLTVSETVYDETISCVITAQDEVVESGGYVRNNKTLTTVVVTEDDVNDRCHLVCDNFSWTGGIDGFVTAGCMLFDDTPAADVDKTIIGYLNFEFERTIALGMILPINTLVLDLTYTASGTTYTVIPSNHFLFQLSNKELNPADDVLKFILMTTGYTFNRDTHATYADVSGSELAAGNGYLQNTTVLANPVLTEDDTNNWAEVTFDTVTISAVGGNIGPTPGFIVYDNTSADDTVVGYWKFDVEKTASDGFSHGVAGIKIRIP